MFSTEGYSEPQLIVKYWCFFLLPLSLSEAGDQARWGSSNTNLGRGSSLVLRNITNIPIERTLSTRPCDDSQSRHSGKPVAQVKRDQQRINGVTLPDQHS